MTIKDFFARALERGPRFWGAVMAIAPLRRIVNRLIIGSIAGSVTPRPRPLSLWGPSASHGDVADYVSWVSLVDRSFTGRHLPPAEAAWLQDLPPEAQIKDLFRTVRATNCPKSTALFAFFAQWFTDSFLRTDPKDPRKNTSNHEIDLCQIYGLEDKDTHLLRSKVGGKLRSEHVRGAEYPAPLTNAAGIVQPHFVGLSYIGADPPKQLDRVVLAGFREGPPKLLFATGLERGNQSIYYAAINTIFLREHNRLCDEFAAADPTLDDDRLFEYARNTNIAQLLKIIVEDYINHISSKYFKFSLEIGWAEKKNWYRTNRIAAEFDLLYRWHSLVPHIAELCGVSIAQKDFRFDNTKLVEHGVEEVIASMVAMRAGQINLLNTPTYLEQAEWAGMKKARDWRIRPFNDYRQYFGLSRYTSFDDLAGSPAVATVLQKCYRRVDDVELLVGLFAEGRDEKSVFGDLMALMVGTDAFTQALTNPLLAKAIYDGQRDLPRFVGLSMTPSAFPAAGRASIDATTCFGDIVARNSQLEKETVTFGSARMPIRVGSDPADGVSPIPGPPVMPLLTTLHDTLAFVCGADDFLWARKRKYRSNVFRARVFEPMIVITDPAAMGVLFESSRIAQDDKFGWARPAPALVGHVLPTVFASGPDHDRPKAVTMHLLQRRLPTLVPTFDAVLDRYTSRWLQLPKVCLRDELEDFAATLVFKWLLDIEVDPRGVRKLYLKLFSHPLAGIARWFPFSNYSRSLEIFHGLLQQTLASPVFEEIVLPEATRAGVDADRETIAKQVLFVVGMNAFLGIQNLAKSVLAELGSRTELRRQLREEIGAAIAESPVDSIYRLSADVLPLLDRSIREVLRLHPPVAYIFGRPTEDLKIEANDRHYLIRKHELLMGAISVAQRSDACFTDPDTFNAWRMFGAPASKSLIWPRGLHDGSAEANNRTCPAKDIVVLMMKLLCVRMLPSFEWTFEKKLRWSSRDFGLGHSAPKGRLDLESFARRG